MSKPPNSINLQRASCRTRQYNTPSNKHTQHSTSFQPEKVRSRQGLNNIQQETNITLHPAPPPHFLPARKEVRDMRARHVANILWASTRLSSRNPCGHFGLELQSSTPLTYLLTLFPPFCGWFFFGLNWVFFQGERTLFAGGPKSGQELTGRWLHLGL